MPPLIEHFCEPLRYLRGLNPQRPPRLSMTPPACRPELTRVGNLFDSSPARRRGASSGAEHRWPASCWNTTRAVRVDFPCLFRSARVVVRADLRLQVSRDTRLAQRALSSSAPVAVGLLPLLCHLIRPGFLFCLGLQLGCRGRSWSAGYGTLLSTTGSREISTRREKWKTGNLIVM